ncbi:PQQ enzyme repeat domain protein [Baumannia cicadellinicola str. Hc (Homalodisca coagulata)]|uniref:Outer membrane protein assembly factor BamB n=2 Tax=Candidatus Palibaumannia cicadellinicola TaxID=186490 RepID=Q1LU75_BAUCH|nr:PQQ enzyme repeat domain protein [Baumannia cicadellinicola str. Hc (Homalodisca coagulata)]MCJ7461998.1 outer membrane protein assembly factor BamB [Candidatus Baumannia cicadellinicola]MCJ7462927.1 outer membrane protein assembly factor BamB [Candidatus Baumannia cicadellinicola]
MLLNGCVLFNNKSFIINHEFQLIEIWNYTVGNSTQQYYSALHPVCQDTYIFVANRNGIVKALAINTGQEIWSVNLSRRKSCLLPGDNLVLLSGGITVMRNRIYIGSEKAKVYALKTEDGSLLWETTVSGEVLSTPVVSNNMVIVYTSNSVIQALNESDGIVKWTIHLNRLPKLTLRGQSSPAIAFGTAIIGDNYGQVHAILIDQGQLIWQKAIYSNKINSEMCFRDIQASPVVEDNILYAVAYNGNLVAINLLSSNIIWLRAIGSLNDFLVKHGTIYIVDQDDRVIAVDAINGSTLWSQNQLLHRKLTSPILYNGYIVIGDSQGYLHWVNVADGSLKAKIKIDNSGLRTKPILGGDKLIIQAQNGKLYAFSTIHKHF